ncbi:MAG: hypothetical protein ABSD28_06990 [Tepidisphaeraceae bacterium]|jgi:hypothetical protein
MANIAIQDGAAGANSLSAGAGSLSVRTALRLAWATWTILLIVPFLLFLGVVWTLTFHEATRLHPETHRWFLASSGYLLVVVPASFFWRGRIFKSYWSGQPIAPAKYLYGMLATWTALEFGGIISLLGCFVDQSLLPNLLPALLAFMFYATLWPSGRSMVRSVGHAEDAEVYEEPR